MNLNLIQQKADLFKALAHPARLSVIDMLSAGERCVCELLAAIDIEQSNLSQHLALLRRLGIVDCAKEGSKVIYRLRCPQILLIYSLMGDVVADLLTREPLDPVQETGE